MEDENDSMELDDLPETRVEHWSFQYEPRTKANATRLRESYGDQLKILARFGYHPERTFDFRHPYSDIFHALQPELLHQVSKLFFDDIHLCILQIMGEPHLVDPTVRQQNQKKRKKNVGSAKARGELDARLSRLPPFGRLRHFKKGITEISRWQGNEIRTMIQVYLGFIHGLVPNEAVRLVSDATAP